MSVIDIAILLLLAMSAVLGFRSGLIQSAVSLVGLIAGIAIASWNYKRFAAELAETVHSLRLAEAIWFCVIALAVMLVAALVGMALRSMIHGVGLAWLDRLLGMIFGLLRGAVLVTLCLVTLAAFFPEIGWLGDARLARYFLGSAHLTTHMTPDELKLRILDGLHGLEKDSPIWLRSK